MAGDVIIAVRLTPRAGRDEVVGPDERGVLRVRVAAAPVEGGANRALLRTLAAALDVAPSRLDIVSGAGSRQKRVRVAGAGAAFVRGRWPGLVIEDR
jgi:uncharacterized protein